VSEFLWRDCLPQSQRLPHIVGAAKGEFDSKAPFSITRYKFVVDLANLRMGGHPRLSGSGSDIWLSTVLHQRS
jgi:hypothetical protein